MLIETARRHGRFDVAGAITSTAGMTAVVFGLVEAGSNGWAAPITFVSLVAGAVLLWLFVRIEKTAAEPILPLRILADRTRASANVARGLGYAGMYGMIFFLTQFLQDIQRHSSLITGIGFLPAPTSVFLCSQLTSQGPGQPASGQGDHDHRARCAWCWGCSLPPSSTPTLRTCRCSSASSCIGAGMGISFVSLTTAGLAGVAPSDAGAASGLINVMQQLGAALGLAVLVTVFDTVTPERPLRRTEHGCARQRSGSHRAGARNRRDNGGGCRLRPARVGHRGVPHSNTRPLSG